MRNVLKRIWKGWSTFILFVNRVIVYVLLSLLFFLLITPQALFRRLMNRKIKRKGLVAREYVYGVRDLEKPW